MFFGADLIDHEPVSDSIKYFLSKDLSETPTMQNKTSNISHHEHL